MSLSIESIASNIDAQLGGKLTRVVSTCGELSYDVAPQHLVAVCTELRDNPAFKFEQLIDATGVDYLSFGEVEWNTQQATGTGFSRGVQREVEQAAPTKRFAVAYHLLSVVHNMRLRVRAFAEDNDFPVLDSLVGVWASANWFEREVFDLYGVLFNNHPDLRRILTDYGFIGHPFRKDFPLIGNVEVRYDETKGRVVYQPVSIEPRVLVPRVIRDDNRYNAALK